MTPRAAALQRFLAATPWAEARRATLAGDASTRVYHRLTHPDLPPAIVMDADPAAGADVRPFVAMTEHLRALDLSAPQIHHADPAAGFLLLEDLGDALFARIAPRDPQTEQQLYACAVDLLAMLHTRPVPKTLPPYDLPILLREARLAVDVYAPAATGQTPDPAAFDHDITKAAEALASTPPVCTLRDYHAENLIWLPDRQGLARCGLLDYQDALAGHPAYDLVSLLEDARRDTTPALRAEMLARYQAASNADPDQLQTAFCTLGAQRNLKILGLFTRLWLRDGKPQYLDLLPRVWNHLQRDLQAPHLATLAAWIATHLPAPTSQIRARIKAAGHG